MKLNDAKFLQRSIERSTVPKRAEAPSTESLAALRGTVGHKLYREAQNYLPYSDGSYEPVSFVHPHLNRRVYGWLVAVDGRGNARVEIGDGEYAIVPPDEIRRLGGKKEDREAVQARLKKVIGQVSMTADGIRADLHETQSLLPLAADDDTLQLLSLSYAATLGVPTEEEVDAYVARFYPTAAVVEADASMPGRIGVALRVEADVDLEAEMGAAHGGEVLETLDPDDVAGDVVEKDAGMEREALWPFSQLNQKMPWNRPKADPKEAARALAASGDTNLIGKALEVYFANGGGKALAAAQGSFDTEGLLHAAMPVVKNAKPSLWRQIVQATIGQMSAQTQPTQTQQPGAQPQTQPGAQPGAQNTPDMNLEFEPDVAPQAQPQYSGDMQSLQQLVQTEMNPAAPGEETNVGPGGSSHVGPTPMSPAPTAPPAPGAQPTLEVSQFMAQDPTLSRLQKGTPAFDTAVQDLMTKGIPQKASRRAGMFERTAAPHLSKEGLPPSMQEAFNSMKMHRMARRGDYVVARVEWDPKLFDGVTDRAAQNTVTSFIKAQAGSMKQGANFGIIGRIHFLSFNAKKGSAQVQFASEFAGPATLEVVERGD